jgi:hypothetical protein
MLSEQEQAKLSEIANWTQTLSGDYFGLSWPAFSAQERQLESALRQSLEDLHFLLDLVKRLANG